MLVYLVAELGVITHWVKIARFRVLSPVMADSRNGKRGAVRACPYHIRTAKLRDDVLRRDGQDIGIQVDVFKVL